MQYPPHAWHDSSGRRACWCMWTARGAAEPSAGCGLGTAGPEPGKIRRARISRHAEPSRSRPGPHAREAALRGRGAARQRGKSPARRRPGGLLVAGPGKGGAGVRKGARDPRDDPRRPARQAPPWTSTWRSWPAASEGGHIASGHRAGRPRRVRPCRGQGAHRGTAISARAWSVVSHAMPAASAVPVDAEISQELSSRCIFAALWAYFGNSAT